MLILVSAFIVIIGIALASIVVSNPPSTIGSMTKAISGLLKGDRFGRASYNDLLKMLYDLFMLARREGMVALEQHVEEPESSAFFQQFPTFTANHYAMEFVSDTLKTIITGEVAPMDLAEMMDTDLEAHYKSAKRVPDVLRSTSDAMPGFGIVTAVLIAFITMGSMGVKAEDVDHHVAAALGGTFLGVLVGYGIFSPMAKAVERQIQSEKLYMNCIRAALLAFARGDAPLTAAEFARRSIEPANRCSFSEMEVRLTELSAS